MAHTSWALITGGSSGIGLEFAKIFAQKGINIVLAARDEAGLRRAAQQLQDAHGIKTLVYCGDLSDISVAEGLYNFIKQQQLAVDYLINSAGFGDYGAFLDAEWPRLQKMIDLNITALTYLTKVLAKDMKHPEGGKIVNIASVAAFLSGPNMAVYYATKAYVLHFSEAISNEFSSSGVTVTVLCPGPTKSQFAKSAKAGRSTIFKNDKLPTAQAVANFGYQSMLDSKVVAIYGRQNRLLIFLTRFMARKKLTEIARRLQG